MKQQHPTRSSIATITTPITAPITGHLCSEIQLLTELSLVAVDVELLLVAVDVDFVLVLVVDQ